MERLARKLAVVTGASSGIGFELAKIAAQNGFDLVVAADEPQIHDAAKELRSLGAGVRAIEVDLATPDGVEDLDELLSSGPDVDALFANAGRGLGKAFLDQAFEDWCHVIDTNITGTLYLIQKVGGRMRERGEGKILITGSIAGFMPGSFQAVYNGTKAFIDSFSFAVREELKDTGVSVTLPDAGRHRDPLLRAGRHARHQGRDRRERRSRGGSQDRLRRNDGRRGRRRERLEEQASVRTRQRHAG
jgi:short-subunit dehydrogenase